MNKFDPTIDIKDLPERIEKEKAKESRSRWIEGVGAAILFLCIVGLIPGVINHFANWFTQLLAH